MHISILGNLTLDDVKCCNINVRYYFNINLVLGITICGNKHTILCSLTHFKKQNIKKIEYCYRSSSVCFIKHINFVNVIKYKFVRIDSMSMLTCNLYNAFESLR